MYYYNFCNKLPHWWKIRWRAVLFLPFSVSVICYIINFDLDTKTHEIVVQNVIIPRLMIHNHPIYFRTFTVWRTLKWRFVLWILMLAKVSSNFWKNSITSHLYVALLLTIYGWVSTFFSNWTVKIFPIKMDYDLMWSSDTWSMLFINSCQPSLYLYRDYMHSQLVTLHVECNEKCKW